MRRSLAWSLRPNRPDPVRLADSHTGFHYGPLLGLIGLSLVFQLAAPSSDWARFVTVVLQGATLLLALWTSGARPAVMRIATVFIALAFIGSITALITGGDSGKAATAIVNVLLVGMAPVAVAIGVVRNVRETHAVTFTTMFGVLCIYLMLGMVFSFAYGAIDALGSESVFVETLNPGQADFLYYSYTTLTTTGFGDLTVNGGLARAFTISEALLGQIYLVTVVAAIISNMRPRRQQGEERQSSDA